jgi:ABC-type lipoprotein release transport system permease subunit
LDHVLPLVREFEQYGIPVKHSGERILELRGFELMLGRLFWLILIVSVGAGFLGLVSILFASVERKQRDYGFLRLLGIPVFALVMMPLLQTIILSSLGFFFSYVLFLQFSESINAGFAGQWQSSKDEYFCFLARKQIWTILLSTLSLGGMATLVAMSWSSRLDPADALRTGGG